MERLYSTLTIGTREYTFRWSFMPLGSFQVKSRYQALSGGHNSTFSWKAIWGTSLHSKFPSLLGMGLG